MNSDEDKQSVFARWRNKLKSHTAMHTPLSSMRNFYGLATSYWLKSNERASAWFLTAGIVAMTVALSKTSVYTANAWAETQDTLYRLGNETNRSTPEELGTAALGLGGIVLTRLVLLAGGRHLMSSNLHRRARRWLVGQYNSALFNTKHTHLHITSDKNQDEKLGKPLPDNIDQRVDECSGAFYGSLIGLPMGLIGAVSSMFFVLQEMAKTSTPMESLSFLGSYATCALAFGVAATYVGPNTYVAYKFGQLEKRLAILKQKADGTWRGEMGNVFRRASQVAASQGEKIQSNILGRLYDRVDTVWLKQTFLDSAFLGFKNSYNYFAHKGVSYVPYLFEYMKGDIDLKAYLAGSELTSELIGDLSWFVNVMPALANIKANSDRLTDISQSCEEIHNVQEFYQKRGISKISRGVQEANQGLTVKNINLMFAGHDNPKTFFEGKDLNFKAGEWTSIIAENGAGKSLFIKALTGQWMFGEADIYYPEGKKTMYASQEPDIPELLTLKELVCYPRRTENFSDVEVSAKLNKVGLGQFIENMHDELYAGKSWKDVFSGGQKQKLVQSRILLHKPDILFLDEATSAMDPASTKYFYETIKAELPETTVIAVTHYDFMPKFSDGKRMFDKVLHLEESKAKIYDGRQFDDIIQHEKAKREIRESGQSNPSTYWFMQRYNTIPEI